MYQGKGHNHHNEKRDRSGGGGWICLGGRANKSLSIPPICARVSCYVSLQSRSICPETPTDTSAPPPHRQRAPIGRDPDSSPVCSQLPRWLHRPVSVPTHPTAGF
ncbi:hypothetical protein CesoFtcFv8_007225 [Champsocephalus esox]|uniref:Uncharacterized protein n=1 Tax=Champsocephalus esox TaxID=159716 RepID=A0AAN8H4A9_9TELE|nr:hypothetical protein CesoFtcFv8_007225 [Champsocephalus esox]